MVNVYTQMFSNCWVATKNVRTLMVDLQRMECDVTVTARDRC
jgi:hypothetical protein